MAGEPEKSKLKLGFIPLTDCAPLVIAHEKGYFERYGLAVTLSRESSWANIRDKVSIGLLDGAHMLAGLPIAATLGLGSAKTPMLTALSLDLNGNAITVSSTLHERMTAVDPAAMSQPATTVHALRRVIEQDKAAGKSPMTFAMVFPTSSHHYALRYWMAAAGINPDRDVRLIVIPPPQMANYLEARAIEGYCVGEPWNTLAVSSGLGRTLITSYDIWNNHPEKVFAVTAAWAEQYPNTHQTLLMALLAAARWLDEPDNRIEAARILACGRYVNAPVEVIRASMTGTYQYSADRAPALLPDFNVFYRYAATFPWRSHAVWLLTQMYRWGQIATPLNIHVIARQVYQPELYRRAAEALGLAYPLVDYKSEGEHAEAWVLANASTPLPMGPDRFLDGARFDPNELPGYLSSFAIQDYRVQPPELAQLNR